MQGRWPVCDRCGGENQTARFVRICQNHPLITVVISLNNICPTKQQTAVDGRTRLLGFGDISCLVWFNQDNFVEIKLSTQIQDNGLLLAVYESPGQGGGGEM